MGRDANEFWPLFTHQFLPREQRRIRAQIDLWILSRTPQMDESVYRQLLAKMAARGFKVEQMIKTPQSDDR